MASTLGETSNDFQAEIAFFKGVIIFKCFQLLKPETSTLIVDLLNWIFGSKILENNAQK